MTETARIYRLSAAAIRAGLKMEYGPTHPQAGKFNPAFLESVAKDLDEAAAFAEALEPFAEAGEVLAANEDRPDYDQRLFRLGTNPGVAKLTVRDLCRAAVALKRHPPAAPEGKEAPK